MAPDSLSPSKLGTCVTSNSGGVVLAKGESKTHYFCRPSHTPRSSTPAPLSQFRGIPMVFIFPSRAGGSWQVFTQALDSAARWAVLPLLPLPLASLWSHVLPRCFGTPSHRLCSAVPLSSLKAVCACMWSFLLVGECVGESVLASSRRLVRAAVFQLCSGTSRKQQAASVSGVWPQRLRISTWEWTTIADAQGTDWAGSLPGSNCSKRSLEVGDGWGLRWQFRRSILWLDTSLV